MQRVIDGDTVQLTDGRLVRYVGIDTPEVRRRVGETWVLDPEPFAEVAMEANRRLVEGRRVRLEYDVQTHDRFAVETSHTPHAFADALRRLAALNLADPHPPRWVAWLFYDHPPITQRIQAAERVLQ